jgi:hypothetical protein
MGVGAYLRAAELTKIRANSPPKGRGGLSNFWAEAHAATSDKDHAATSDKGHAEEMVSSSYDTGDADNHLTLSNTGDQHTLTLSDIGDQYTLSGTSDAGNHHTLSDTALSGHAGSGDQSKTSQFAPSPGNGKGRRVLSYENAMEELSNFKGGSLDQQVGRVLKMTPRENGTMSGRMAWSYTEMAGRARQDIALLERQVAQLKAEVASPLLSSLEVDQLV